MADSASPLPETTSAVAAVNSQQPPPDSDTKTSAPDPSPAPSSSVLPPPPPPPSIQSYSAVPPSFRPAAPPAPVPGVSTPLFSPIPNPNLQQQQQSSMNYSNNPSVQPPGVSSVAPPQLMQPAYAMPGQLMRPYAPMPPPNGYTAMPQQPGAMPPPGILRYPSPYTPMVRPVFPPRPGAVGIIPPLMRPPMPIIRTPIIAPAARPAAIPSITQIEKPQTTVYVGKISSTAENEFMLSLLQLCGPVRSWKRAQDPTNGSLKGFGFCEFESAEGVLRALRLLNKLSIDGQALMLNVNQATRDYLERYVEKKVESSKKAKESEDDGVQKEEESVPGGEKNESAKISNEPSESTTEESKDSGAKGNKENFDAANFGLVADEDRQADKEALEKLKDMLEERLKNKPLPPPPPPPQTAKDGSDNSNMVNPKDGEPDRDTAKNEEKNEDELISESKASSENDKAEIGSPDHRRHDRRSRDLERDLKREKERELERYEREREQDRAKREKEREYKIREDERRYKAREKDWESREREREHSRKREREREKQRAQDRKWDILEQERESEDGYRKRKHRTSDEERKRRQREKEDDLADRLKEEKEIAEEKRRAEEEKQKKEQEEALKILSGHLANGREKAVSYEESNLQREDKNIETAQDDLSQGEEVVQNGTSDEESVLAATVASDTRHNSNAPAKKLGFGLLGSGKRAAVPSVFNADEDEDTQKEKKMRPLVPIDYSADEQHMAQPSISEEPPAVAAEFVKRTSNVNPKEEKPDGDKDRHRKTHDRSSQRDRDRHNQETNRTRDESRHLDHDRVREPRPDKVKTPENKKLLDAKQLIDMIPKTKDELFSYEINWAIYDKNALHERMRPWISKKITDFLGGEEEPTLVDYIVTSTQEHVKATEMLERLSSILDEEAEMFVLKMWRMLIFEIKKVETGLALRPKS